MTEKRLTIIQPDDTEDLASILERMTARLFPTHDKETLHGSLPLTTVPQKTKKCLKYKPKNIIVSSKIEKTGEIIKNSPDNPERAFIARQLVQATLPHSDPGDEIRSWSRRNGTMILSIVPGYDTQNDKSFGFPYGTIPRLLLFWMTTEAVRTKSPKLSLGDSVAEFMRELGLNSRNGGQNNVGSDANRLRNQMERLFHAIISFTLVHESSTSKAKAWMDMQVAPKGLMWWDSRSQNKATLAGSWIELTPTFFDAITSAPIPVDMRALRAVKNSPLALDLYSWAAYTAFQATRTSKTRSISWNLLHRQIGGDYKDDKEFGRKSRMALYKIAHVYPNLKLEFMHGGVKIFPTHHIVAPHP